MRYLLAILLIAATASAQIVTYDSRYDARPDWRNPVDLADRKPSTNPDFETWLLQWTTPAMIDREMRIGVAITGTLAQAQADLSRAVSNTYPATVRLKGLDRSQYAESGRTNSNNGAASMRVDLTKLFEMVAEINERLERLEAR